MPQLLLRVNGSACALPHHAHSPMQVTGPLLEYQACLATAQVSRAHALVDELRMRVAARVPAELEAQCAALAARGGLGPPPPGALADDPLPLPDPAAPGWAGADANGAADGGEFEELAKGCCLSLITNIHAWAQPAHAVEQSLLMTRQHFVMCTHTITCCHCEAEQHTSTCAHAKRQAGLL